MQSRLFWTCWKLQRETATCDTPWLHRKTTQKENKIDVGSLRWGLGVVIQTYFLVQLSLYQTFHLSAMTPVFTTCFEEIAV